MAIKYLNNIDLVTNELQHAVIQPLISPPTDLTAKLGQVYYNTLDDKLKIYTSVGWVTVGGVSSITSGNINTITIGGTIFNPTVSANTAPVTSGSLNLVTGNDVYNFISAFGYVPSTRQLSINGTQYDLSVDRSWSVGTVTSVSFNLGTTGTDLNSSIVNSTTTPVITLNVPTASASNRGALSAADWSTFNAKQAALTFGNLTSTDITVTGGTASIIGAGSILTLATVNANVGTFGSSTAIPVITVNGKGLITTLTTTAVSIPSGALSFIGDVTGSGTTGSNTTLTLAIVNTNVGTYGSSTSVPTITVNAKGLVTAASQTTIPSATSSITGLLTSTDWVTFNSKLTRNTAITGATKTKISYDVNGLVTNGVDATTADIADSTNKRYVTDANLIVINNTSNTNTGDQGLQSVTDINAITTKTITAASFIKNSSTGTNILLDDGNTIPISSIDGTVTSVGVSMPSAFTVTNSPVNTSGTIAVTGAGLASQYIRGDGQLASFPDIAGGGGGQVYYCNGGTSQGTIGGSAFYQISTGAILLTGVDFTSGTVNNVAFANFITDIGKPTQEVVPAGVWIFQCYLSASATNSLEVYSTVEIYDGSTFNVLATSLVEVLTGGTSIDLYTFTCAVPEFDPLVTADRIAIRFYPSNLSGGNTITLHTQDSHLSSIQTTFTTGLASLNGLTSASQLFAKGTSGNDFNIYSAGATHTFNIPDASSASGRRGLLIADDWITFNSKEPAITIGTTSQYWRGDKSFQTLNTLAVPELTNLYYTDSRSRLALSSSATGLTYTNTTGVFSLTSGYLIPTSASYNNTNWDTAYADRNKWDGGATGLNASTGRISLGANTIGSNVFTSTNPSAITFLQANANNTVSWLDAASFRTAIGAGTGGGSVTSVAALTLTSAVDTDLTSTVANSTTTPVITLNVPDAGAGSRGVVTTGAQTFAGVKTFATNGVKYPGTGNGLIATINGGGILTTLPDTTYPNLTELTFVRGTTSNIQTQLNYDASAIQRGAVTTGVQTFAGNKTFSGTVSAVELKLPNIANQTLLIADSNNFITGLDTDIYPNLNELALLKGVTSNIQTQLNYDAGPIQRGAITTGVQTIAGNKTFVGSSILKGTSVNDGTSLGPEILTVASISTNWVGTSFANGYVHSTGSTSVLQASQNVLTDSLYQVQYTISYTGGPAGSFTISVGGATSPSKSLSGTGYYTALTTSITPLTITPSSTFNGRVIFSLKIINPSSSVMTIQSSNGVIRNEFRYSTTGGSNMFLGFNSGGYNSSGSSNTFVGFNSGRFNSTGNDNTALGQGALYNNTSGSANIAIGGRVLLSNLTGNDNTAIGTQALFSNIGGYNNNAFGTAALTLNTEGYSNNAFGSAALGSNTTGYANVAIGEQALQANTTGYYNIALGTNSGNNVAGGSNNITIGYGTTTQAASDQSSIVIGTATNGLGSNTTVIGNGSTVKTAIYGNLLLGTTTDIVSSRLTVNSTTQGFLPPRMTTTQKNAIATPATGLVVYDTDLLALYQYNGSAWVVLGGGSGTVTSVAALTLGTTGNDLSSTVATGNTTPVITLNVPNASATARGVITTGAQTIAGEKTFSTSPKAPTPAIGTNDTTLATTAFVNAIVPGNIVYNILIGTGTGTGNITTETTGTSGSLPYTQNGRNVMINNGATAISVAATIISTAADFIASYTKIGSATITFTFTGTGAILIAPNGAILSGSAGSTALLTKNGTTVYLLINNLI